MSDDKKAPRFALAGNKPAPPYFIVDSDKEAFDDQGEFDDSKYTAGDEVPGIIVASLPATGGTSRRSTRGTTASGRS